ncbi:MAG: glycerophosphodiester phosphodiesterase [Clostridia bacterium]|nr:glycerophosphodiester phosphodiesterase [Clostridia bacterium]
MVTAIIIVAVLIVLILLYLLSLRGRRNHPKLSKLRKWAYAHRGLHNKPQIPENSMHAFYLALQKGYGIELDVHLLRDGEIAVIHDSTLERTTGRKGKIEHLTSADLARYNLEGTDETIPLFRDVLAMFDGKAPIIVELKTAGGNASKLCEAVFRLLDNYKGLYCVESFDPRCLIWLKKHRPKVCRGQLAQNFFKSTSGMGKIVDFVLTFLLENFLTRPDFIAYKFSDRKNISNVLCRKLWKIQGVSWTLRSKAVYHEALGEGLIPIFEKFEP